MQADTPSRALKIDRLMVIEGLVTNSHDWVNGTGDRIFIRELRIVADDVALALADVQGGASVQRGAQTIGPVSPAQGKYSGVSRLIGKIAPGGDNLATDITKLAQAKRSGAPAQRRAQPINLHGLLVGC